MKRFALSANRRQLFSIIAFAGLLALAWKGALPGVLTLVRGKAATFVPSKPVVNTHVSGAEIPQMALIGDEFCYTARITNSGDTGPGFVPYLRLITPGGVTLTSATLLNVGGGGIGTEPSTVSLITPAPLTLPAQDPLLPSGNIVTGTGLLWIIQPPIGSVYTGQANIDIRICLRISSPTLLNQQVPITHQPVYLYGTGSMAPNNGSFVLGDPVTDNVMPVVVKFRKVVLNAPVNDTSGQAPLELVTGPCNAVTFQLVADIATTVTLTNLMFNDLLPMVNGAAGLELTNNPNKQVKIITPGGSKTVNANITGNVLSVSELSASGVLVSNVPSDQDVVVEFQANVPKAFFNNASINANCPLQNLTNTATFDAQYNGLSISQLSSSLSFTVKVASLQKTASPAVAAPGDIINFTLKVVVSESDNLSLAHINDTLPDGLTYVSGSAKLMINGNDASGFLFPPVNYLGKTLQINITANGSNTPLLGACVLNEITYQAVVDQNYANGAPVLAGDKLSNVAKMGYERFNNDHKQCFEVNGYTENATSQVVIKPVNEVTKAIINNPLPSQFLPGDKVKFSLKICVPSGNAKSIEIKDYLPAPFFDLSTVAVTNFIKTPSTVNALPNPPVVSTQDNSVTFTISPDPFVTNPTTPTCFEIQFEVTVANVALQQPLSVTNYLVAKTIHNIINGQGVEDSHTTGVVLTIGQGNPVLSITKSICSVGTGASGTVNSSGDVDNADASDKLNYCITIKNESQVPAYNINFMDTVPAGLSYVGGSLNVTGATPDATGAPTLKATASQLGAGQTITVLYMATINGSVTPCQIIKNEAEVKWASTSGGQPTNSAKDTAVVNIAKPSLTQTIKSTSEPIITQGNQVTIGEEITYEIKLCLPEGTIPAFTIQDMIPANLTCLSAKVSGALNGSFDCSGTWNVPSFTVPGDNDPGNNCIVIELTTRVRDIPANMGMQGSQTVITNKVTVDFPNCPPTLTDSEDAIVVEPKLTIDKTINPASVIPGQPVTVTLTVANTGTSSAYDVKVDDFLPTNLINPVKVSSPNDFAFSSSTGLVTFQGGEVKPGSAVNLVFTLQAHVPCQPGTNVAAINAASTLPGDKTGERIYANITDTADYEVKCECTTPPYLNTKGMTAWWTFDETSGATAPDIANAQNDGTKINTISVPSELVGRSLQFNGTSAYVKVPGNQADLQFGKGDFSIDAWIKPPSAPAATAGIRPIVDKTIGAVVGNTLTLSGYTLFLDDGHLRARVGTTLYPSNNTTGPHLGDNKWHHVALTVHRPNASELVLYVDGKPIFNTTAVSITSVTNISDLTIGRGNQVLNLFKDFFSGRIDEVELFKVALTPQNVMAIYRAGSAGKCKPVCMLTCPPTTLPNGTVNQVYPSTAIVLGGTATYKYDPVTLPPGMSLDTADGKLKGTPTATGDYSFTIITTDQNGCSKTCTYTIKVVCGGLTMTTASPLPNGTLSNVYKDGQNQTVMIKAQGGCGSFVYTQSGGTMPPGISLLPDGTLQGTPKACGAFDFSVTATDKCGCTVTKSFSLTVKGVDMAISDAFNTGVNNDKSVRSTGQSELHYAATANGNPVNVFVIPKQQSWVSPTNNAAAWIGPGPAQGGVPMTYTLMVDLANYPVSTIQITGQYAASVSGYITVNNSATQYSPTTSGATGFTSFSLPASAFTGGTKNSILFHVNPGSGGVASGLLVEFSSCPCMVTVGPDVLPDGKAGTAYTGQFTATGGVPPYTFMVTGNPMPPGIGVGQDGKISGTPVLCGEYTLIVKVTDSQGCMGLRVYKFKVKCSDVVIDYNPDENPSSGLAGQQQPTTSFLTARIKAQILGNEKTIRFSLGFDPALLSNPIVTLGSGAQNATLDIDPSELDQGNLGISITQPDGVSFAEGRQEVAVITWEYISSDRGRATRIEFRGSPVSPAIITQSGAALETQFKSTPVVLATKAAIVSAASYSGERIASEQIVAAFGIGLATSTQVATTVPLPTTLAGTTIKVRDSANVERLAPLFFVAPTQINYLIPAGTSAGTATVIITGGDGTVSGAVVEIANVAPGIFVADASGRGVPAANVLTYKPDGSSTSQSVARFDPATGRFVAVPIDLGAVGDRVFLSLYATGARKRSSLENVRAIVNGVEAPIQYAGDQGGFVGLDQVNIELPRSLAGNGLVDVVLIVDGVIANTVQVNIL